MDFLLLFQETLSIGIKKEFHAILGQNYHFQGKLVPPSNTDQTTSIRVKK
jgi:hypothetical protein